MALTFAQRLQKKHLTAEELGRLSIINFVISYMKEDNKQSAIEYAANSSKIEKKLSHLNSEEAVKIYLEYASMLTSIKGIQHRAEYFMQRMFWGLSEMGQRLTVLETAERMTRGLVPQFSAAEKAAVQRCAADMYFRGEADLRDTVSCMANARQAVIESLYFVNGFNHGLDIIADLYKIKEVTKLRFPEKNMRQQIEQFNSRISQLQDWVLEEAAAPGVTRKKLGVLKEVFYPVNIADTEVPKAKILQAKKQFTSFHTYGCSGPDPYLALCRKD